MLKQLWVSNKVPTKGNLNATAAILDNSVLLTLWQQFEKRCDGQMSTSICPYSVAVIQSAFVTDSPVLYSVKRLLVGDVIHEQETHGSSVVCCGDGAISLLTCSVLHIKEDTQLKTHLMTL